jgi:hypothetical protein
VSDFLVKVEVIVLFLCNFFLCPQLKELQKSLHYSDSDVTKPITTAEVHNVAENAFQGCFSDIQRSCSFSARAGYFEGNSQCVSDNVLIFVPSVLELTDIRYISSTEQC